MDLALVYSLLADAVLILHVGVVIFVVGGLVMVFAGNLRGWQWVNTHGFRLIHLAAIGIVVVQSWLVQACPLTDLESWLRLQAGESVYPASFIEVWLQRLLFYESPFWVFTLVYTLFGLLVVATWVYFPPQKTAAPTTTRPVPD